MLQWKHLASWIWGGAPGGSSPDFGHQNNREANDDVSWDLDVETSEVELPHYRILNSELSGRNRYYILLLQTLRNKVTLQVTSRSTSFPKPPSRWRQNPEQKGKHTQWPHGFTQTWLKNRCLIWGWWRTKAHRWCSEHRWCSTPSASESLQPYTPTGTQQLVGQCGDKACLWDARASAPCRPENKLHCLWFLTTP